MATADLDPIEWMTRVEQAGLFIDATLFKLKKRLRKESSVCLDINLYSPWEPKASINSAEISAKARQLLEQLPLGTTVRWAERNGVNPFRGGSVAGHRSAVVVGSSFVVAVMGEKDSHNRKVERRQGISAAFDEKVEAEINLDPEVFALLEEQKRIEEEISEAKNRKRTERKQHRDAYIFVVDSEATEVEPRTL